MTRDELVNVIRNYSNEKHPGWKRVRVAIRGDEGTLGFLLITPTRFTSLSRDEIRSQAFVRQAM